MLLLNENVLETIKMHSELCETYSKILEHVKDAEHYSKDLKHDDMIIEELHIIRNSDGRPVALRAVTRYNSRYTGL